MMLPLGANVEPARLENWDWQPAVNLDHIIQRGLEKPDRAFTVYLKICDRSLSGVIIPFTSDGRIIFGVSIDDEGAVPENTGRAKLLLQEMAGAYTVSTVGSA